MNFFSLSRKHRHLRRLCFLQTLALVFSLAAPLLEARPGDPLLVTFEKNVNAARKLVLAGKVPGLTPDDLDEFMGLHIGGYPDPAKAVNDIDFTVGHKDPKKSKAFAEAIRAQIKPELSDKITIVDVFQTDGPEMAECYKGKLGQKHLYEMVKNQETKSVGRATTFSKSVPFAVLDTTQRKSVTSFLTNFGKLSTVVAETDIFVESVEDLLARHAGAKGTIVEKALQYGKYLERDMQFLELNVVEAYAGAPGITDVQKKIRMDDLTWKRSTGLASLKGKHDLRLNSPDREAALRDLDRDMRKLFGLTDADDLDAAVRSYMSSCDDHLRKTKTCLTVFEASRAKKLAGKAIPPHLVMGYIEKIMAASVNILGKALLAYAAYEIVNAYATEGPESAFIALSVTLLGEACPAAAALVMAGAIGMVLLKEGCDIFGGEGYLKLFVGGPVTRAFTPGEEIYLFSDQAREFLPEWFRGVNEETMAAAVTGMSLGHQRVWQERVIDGYARFLQQQKSWMEKLPLDGPTGATLRECLINRLRASFLQSCAVLEKVVALGINASNGWPVISDPFPFKVSVNGRLIDPDESQVIPVRPAEDGSVQVRVREVRSYSGIARCFLTPEETGGRGLRDFFIARWKELGGLFQFQPWLSSRIMLELESGRKPVLVTVEPEQADGWQISARGHDHAWSDAWLPITKKEVFSHPFDNTPKDRSRFTFIDGEPMFPGQAKSRERVFDLRLVRGPGAIATPRVRVTIAFPGRDAEFALKIRNSRQPAATGTPAVSSSSDAVRPSTHTFVLTTEPPGFAIQPSSVDLAPGGKVSLRAIPAAGASLPEDIVWKCVDGPTDASLQPEGKDGATFVAGASVGSCTITAESASLAIPPASAAVRIQNKCFLEGATLVVIEPRLKFDWLVSPDDRYSRDFMTARMEGFFGGLMFFFRDQGNVPSDYSKPQNHPPILWQGSRFRTDRTVWMHAGGFPFQELTGVISSDGSRLEHLFHSLSYESKEWGALNWTIELKDVPLARPDFPESIFGETEFVVPWDGVEKHIRRFEVSYRVTSMEKPLTATLKSFQSPLPKPDNPSPVALRVTFHRPMTEEEIQRRTAELNLRNREQLKRLQDSNR